MRPAHCTVTKRERHEAERRSWVVLAGAHRVWSDVVSGFRPGAVFSGDARSTWFAPTVPPPLLRVVLLEHDMNRSVSHTANCSILVHHKGSSARREEKHLFCQYDTTWKFPRSYRTRALTGRLSPLFSSSVNPTLELQHMNRIKTQIKAQIQQASQKHESNA